jgi:hypothetical protein
MDHDYKKISTNWNKFLAEGAFNLNEDEEPNLVGQRITKPPKKGKGKIGIVDNILSKLPKPLQSKSMKAALAVGIRAVKDKEVSVKDVWSFVKAATNFARAGDEKSKALAREQLDAEPVAQLPKVNFDVVFSSLLPVAKDPGFAPPDGLTGPRTPDATGGLASLRLTFEEQLNADESVKILTEQDLRLDKAGYLKLLQDLIVEYGEEVIKKHGPGAFNSEKALEVYKSMKADYLEIIRKSSAGAVTDITLKWGRDKEKQKVIKAVHAIAKIPFR